MPQRKHEIPISKKRARPARPRSCTFPADPAEFRKHLLVWYRRHARNLPWRQTRDPYAIMVSEFMLQQTQVATVIPYYLRWMNRFPDLSRLAAASEAEVLACWEGLGYYSRARNLLAAARQIESRFHGRIPRCPKALRTLPGLGEYASAAVAAFAFDLPVPAIDGNTARVLARIGNIGTPVDSTPGRTELRMLATRLMPRRGRRFNSALMELGATVCSPSEPACRDCPVQAFCLADDPEMLPSKRRRSQTVRVEEHCLFAHSRNRVLLRQETGRRMGGMWKLPLHPGGPGAHPVWVGDYSFTHHRIRLFVYEGRPEHPIEGSRWIPSKNLGRTAMIAAHRRALIALLGDRALSAAGTSTDGG